MHLCTIPGVAFDFVHALFSVVFDESESSVSTFYCDETRMSLILIYTSAFE